MTGSSAEPLAGRVTWIQPASLSFRGASWCGPANGGSMLLPVIRQNLGADLAEPRTILLQAGQDHLVALIHMRPAKPRHIPRAAGIRPPALRRRGGDDQEQRNCEQKSGHMDALMPAQRAKTN